MKTLPRVARTTIALFSCSLVLAACGGGGGGGTGGGSVPQATPTPTPAPITKSQARATMQSSLAVVENVNGVSIGGTGTLAIIRRVQAIHHGRRAQSVPGCQSGYTSTLVTHPDGSQTLTDNYYYDALCATIKESDVINVPANVTAQNLTATGTITTYAQTGGVTSYTTLQLALTTVGTQDTVTLTSTIAATVGGAPYGKLGVTCIGPTSGVSISCGDAIVTTASGQQIGVSLNEAVAFTVSGSNVVATSTASASAYVATSGLDILAGTPPAWSITGAAPIDTITASVSITFAGGTTVTGGTIAISDSAAGITIAGTLTTTSISLTASAHGATVATVVVDLSGNGTITYADGSTATITAWTING